MAENETQTVKVGFSQIGRPTPLAAKYVFRSVFFLAVVWSFLAPTITELSPETIAVINSWSLRLAGVVRIAISFFGFDFKEENQ